VAKINKDHVDKWFDYNLDIDNRTIYLGSAEYDEHQNGTGVDFIMAERLIKALHVLDKAGVDKPIFIIMNNPGGSCVDGMAIYDAIKTCRNHVTITVFGDACSMGCVILQAADRRVLSQHSIVMFHEGYDSYSSNHPEINRKWSKFNERYGEKINEILLEKIKEKKPDLKVKKFKELNTFDTILLANEAIDLGLADEILQ